MISDSTKIGDYVEFSSTPSWLPPTDNTKKLVGIVREIEFGRNETLIIEGLAMDAIWQTNILTVRRLPCDVRKLSDEEAMLHKLEN
jgi:hypothetical protein